MKASVYTHTKLNGNEHFGSVYQVTGSNWAKIRTEREKQEQVKVSSPSAI